MPANPNFSRTIEKSVFIAGRRGYFQEPIGSFTTDTTKGGVFDSGWQIEEAKRSITKLVVRDVRALDI